MTMSAALIEASCGVWRRLSARSWLSLWVWQRNCLHGVQADGSRHFGAVGTQTDSKRAMPVSEHTPTFCEHRPFCDGPELCKTARSLRLFHTAATVHSNVKHTSGLLRWYCYNTYSRRLVHTSSYLLRKKKKRTPKPTEAVHNDFVEADEYGDDTNEYANEAHEYADDADEYADEVIHRGYRPSEGHRVLIIQPTAQEPQMPASQSNIVLAEAQALVQTLQKWTVVDSQKISVKYPGKKHMFGKGTHQELTAHIRSQPDLTAAFLNVNQLSGVQKKTLEDAWGIAVLDRYELVLQIFKEHASSREAKLQIALAEIYLKRSHLRQEVTDLDQQSGAQQYIGGGGETLLEKRQRLLRDREGALRKSLEKVKRKRELLRRSREKKHFPHIAVVGYTNAGKTSLIKALTGDAKLQPRDQLFATLDVTSHLGTLSSRLPVIYLDTVGFIANLPHQLVASFAATLEDVLCADLIVHVCDASHPDSRAQRFNVLGVLHDLGIPQELMDMIVEVNNKMDLVQSRYITPSIEDSLSVSATEGTGLDQLKQVIESRLLEVTDRVVCEVRIPQAGSHLSWLYKEATVQEISTIEDDAEHLIVHAIFSSAAYSRFCAKFGELRCPSK